MQFMAVAPAFSRHERFVYLFEDTTLRGMLRRGCADFIAVLGLLTFKQRFDPKRTDLESPDVWRARGLRTRVVRTDLEARGFAVRIEVHETRGTGRQRPRTLSPAARTPNTTYPTRMAATSLDGTS